MMLNRSLCNPLIAGMDTHRTTNVVHLDAERGRGESLGKSLRVSNNRPGIAGLAAQLAVTAQAGGYDGIVLASEATGWYWLGAFYTLQAACSLPTQLYALNPRLTANYKKVLMNDDHADVSDAAVIAERVRMGRDLPAPFAPDTVYAPLRLVAAADALPLPPGADGGARESLCGDPGVPQGQILLAKSCRGQSGEMRPPSQGTGDLCQPISDTSQIDGSGG